MKTNRTLTKKECDWLDKDIPKGTTLYYFGGATYGCISPEGTAVSLSGENQNPFVEIPTGAIDFE